MATQAERRAATRRRLIDAARQRFAADGYDETSTEAIRQEAGVSRGAMYHHFASKREIFEAVFEEVSNETIHASLGESGSGESRVDDLTRACLAWLREVALEDAASAGEIDVVSIPLTARLLNAILAEAALVAVNEAPATAAAELEQTIRQFIEGLTPA